MTADELKSYMLDDFVYDSPTLQFAIYPGIKDGFSYSCTTDIYGKTDEPTQDFKSGVELVYHSSEQIGYAPGLTSGKPGQLHITKGASISAWRHEMRHIIDDYKAGWSGFLILADKEERIRREIRGYNEELKLARKLNRPDIVKRLEVLRENEIKTIQSKNSQK